MTLEEKMKKGLIWTDTEEYLKEQKHAKKLAFKFNNLDPDKIDERKELIHEIFGSVGNEVWIEPRITLARGKTISIGYRTYINANVTFVDDYKIDIGSDVLIAPNVTMVTTGHPVHNEMRQYGEMFSFPIKICNKVWIGANVVIMPGVTIGKNSVIGAGSIVTKDIPENVVAYGNPCKVAREITERDKEFYYKDKRF